MMQAKGMHIVDVFVFANGVCALVVQESAEVILTAPRRATIRFDGAEEREVTIEAERMSAKSGFRVLEMRDKMLVSEIQSKRGELKWLD
jgi:hypothetical protein